MFVNKLIITPTARRTQTVLNNLNAKTAGEIVKQALDIPYGKGGNYHYILNNKITPLSESERKILKPFAYLNDFHTKASSLETVLR